MAENSVAEIRRMIAGSQLLEAANALSQHWDRKDVDLHNLALMLVERCNYLSGETARGVISQSDAELERAKIIDGLLFLTNRIENPAVELPRHLVEFLQAKQKKVTSQKWLFVAAGSILLAVIAYFSMQLAFKPSDFDLKIFLHGLNGLADPIPNAQVKLAFGNYQLSPRTADAQGRVDFTDIPIKYINDSVHLILIDLPYEVVRQSAPTAAQSDKGSLTFELKPIVQWTNWRGTIKDTSGKPIEHVKLDIESGLATATTDTNGNFAVKVPKASGERVQVVAYVAGKQVLNSSFVLTEQIPTQIQLKTSK